MSLRHQHSSVGSSHGHSLYVGAVPMMAIRFSGLVSVVFSTSMGTSEDMIPAHLHEAFWSKIKTGAPSECWPWTASRRRGYGRYGIAKGPTLSAHRVAYALTKGAIPDGLCVLHKCDNPPCCNPDHLILGTIADNNADRKRKGRNGQGGARGTKHRSAKLTDSDVIDIRRAVASGATQPEMANAYGLSIQSVYSIVHRLHWKHIP